MKLFNLTKYLSDPEKYQVCTKEGNDVEILTARANIETLLDNEYSCALDIVGLEHQHEDECIDYNTLVLTDIYGRDAQGKQILFFKPYKVKKFIIYTTKTNLIKGVFNTEEEAAKSLINPSSDEVITSFEYEVDCD